MKILYTKHFSKDIDKITNDVRFKKNLLQFIDRIKQADYLSELGNVRKIIGKLRVMKDIIGYAWGISGWVLKLQTMA